MSDHVLRLVPNKPLFLPDPAAASGAVALLRAYFPQAQEVKSKYFESVSFIDAGENWEGVSCPACGADAEPWWGEAVSAATSAGVSSLATQALCCGTSLQLNELKYGWPVAFGRFVLDVLNPNALGLAPEQLAQLSAQLGCQLLTVHARV